MAKKALKKVTQSVAVPAIATSPTITLPDGTVLTAGMIVTVRDEPGVFRFKYARLGDVTCYGGAVNGEKSDHQWRSFRPDRVLTATANAMAEKLTAKVEADKPAEYALMSPGQKAAWTKKMRNASVAMPVAA